jgi:hypothetical protein
MLAALTVLSLAIPLARGDHRDDVRGLLYRVDAEAHTLRMHPGQPIVEAKAIERQVDQAVRGLESFGLRWEAIALKREAQALVEAAYSGDADRVRAHAITVERLVREVDDALPGPEITH